MTVGGSKRVLLTGATGYVGGRLLTALEQAGHQVRCVARRPEFLKPKIGAGTEVVAADLLDRASLTSAMAGMEVAYYLVHSMGSGGAFETQDRQAARHFAEAACEAGIRRLIYLGGLGDSRHALSPHLRSRQEVGDILRSSGVQTIEFRASIVIGSGSLSFELIRALVERLPIMTTPRWVSVPAQPIAVADLLDYLIAALDLPDDGHHTFEIGGADQMSYGDLMREYARQRGLRRIMIPVPVLTPWLSSRWLGLVTPVYARIGRILIESIKHPTVVHDDAALRVFAVRPKNAREAVASALRNEEQAFAQTRWSDALSASGRHASWGGVRVGNRMVDSRHVQVNVPAEQVFGVIRRIGGATGWYAVNWLWRLRGFIDLLLGGVGMRRGRRDPDELRVGDVIDCWRVEAYEPERLLRLVAEMKLPGRAWLEFEVQGNAEQSTIQQTAMFDPGGLSGLAYWYVLYPMHQVVFSRMLRGIAKACARESASSAVDQEVRVE